MPIFLSAQDVYRVIQRELPPVDVYPDGPATAFFSTADSMATAMVIRDYYGVQKNTYQNNYPISAVDRLPDFENLYLGYVQDSTLTTDQRRARLLSKIRTLRRTTADDMLAVVYTILDPSVQVEIAPWGCGCQGWVLDVSQLDITTILNEFNGLEKTGPNLCQLDAADYGLSPAAFARLQAQAYTYSVLIYGYTLSATERAELDSALSSAEPADSQHIILDGLNPSDSIGGDT